MTGIEPRVAVITDSSLTVRSLVVDSNRIALLPRGVLTVAGMSEGLTAYPSPVDLGPLLQALWWDPVNTRDAEHRFLRESITQAATEASRRDWNRNRIDPETEGNPMLLWMIHHSPKMFTDPEQKGLAASSSGRYLSVNAQNDRGTD